MSITPTLNVAASAVIPSGETDVLSASDFTTGDEIIADSGVGAAAVSTLGDEITADSGVSAAAVSTMGEEEDAALERGRMEILGFN